MKLPTVLRENGDRPLQCTFDERRQLTMCWALEDAVVSSHGRGMHSRGLIHRSMSNMETHAFSRHKIDVRSGDVKAEANFCPFCGSALSAEVEELIAERGNENV